MYTVITQEHSGASFSASSITGSAEKFKCCELTSDLEDDSFTNKITIKLLTMAMEILSVRTMTQIQFHVTKHLEVFCGTAVAQIFCKTEQYDFSSSSAFYQSLLFVIPTDKFPQKLDNILIFS